MRFEMETNSLERIEWVGLLADNWWCRPNGSFEDEVHSVLSGDSPNFEDEWRYRFPKTRAHQLAKARDIVVDTSLTDRLSKSWTPRELRQYLVAEIPGFGPKQASMFLRNIGRSYELAILDTHVLRFLEIHSILPTAKVTLATIKQYENAEQIFTDYAREIGYPVGYLDWAIWATMRAARELYYEHS